MLNAASQKVRVQEAVKDNYIFYKINQSPNFELLKTLTDKVSRNFYSTDCNYNLINPKVPKIMLKTLTTSAHALENACYFHDFVLSPSK